MLDCVVIVAEVYMRKITFILAVICVFGLLVGCNSNISESRRQSAELEKSVFEESQQSDSVLLSILEKDIQHDTKSVTLLISNKSDVEYTFGHQVYLDLFIEGQWYSVPYKETAAWDDIGFVLAPKSEAQNTCYIGDYFDLSREGRYRLVQELYADGDRVIAFCEFEIGGESQSVNTGEPVPDGNLYTAGDGQYSEEMEKNANIVVMVSNQSFDVPHVKMSGTVDELHVFNDEYSVGDQHQYAYYYVYASPGEHEFKVLANGISIKETVTITEDEPLWICFSYWNAENEDEKISVFTQNERILID